MKVGDKVPVTLAGHTVAQATVRELGDGTAVLVVPATQVTMAVRTELDAAPAPVKETETIITGVDRAEAPAADEASATVGTTETVTETTVETPDTTVSETTSETTETTTVEAPTAESLLSSTPDAAAPVETRDVQTTSVATNDTQS